jgi:predicted acyl esterase
VGRIHPDIYIKTSLPDVDVFVRMTDAFPDGHSPLMAQGIQRARYRSGTCPQAVTDQATLTLSTTFYSMGAVWAQVAGDRQRVGRPEPPRRRSDLQRQPAEGRRIHRSGALT